MLYILLVFLFLLSLYILSVDTDNDKDTDKDKHKQILTYAQQSVNQPIWARALFLTIVLATLLIIFMSATTNACFEGWSFILAYLITYVLVYLLLAYYNHQNSYAVEQIESAIEKIEKVETVEKKDLHSHHHVYPDYNSGYH